jgi:hypothetical protein
MRRSLLLLSLLALALLAAGAALAETSKLDPRARIALAELRAGTPLSQMRVAARAVNTAGELDVFVVGDVTREALVAAGARVRTQAGDVFTAYLPADAVEAIAALPGVRRIEGAALCDEELDQSVPAMNVTGQRGAGPTFAGLNGAGVLTGDVDSGLDYNHGDFVDASGTSRVVTLWDQTDTGGPNPSGYAYGSEWTQADLTSLAAREADVSGHGTHVMGIIGGDGSETGGTVPAHTYVGLAPRADLFFVKTTMYTSDILDGVAYLFSKATARGQNAVINLSLGSHYGPHDGTSAFESGLSALSGPGRIVCKSAGNERYNATTNPYYQHAGFNIPVGGDSAKIVVAGGTTNGRLMGLAGYYGAGNEFNVTLRSPGNLFIGPITLGNVNAAYPGATTGVNGRVYLENGVTLTARGDREVYVELTSLGTGTGSITGTWTFYFTPTVFGGSDRVDLWRFYTSSTSLTGSWSLKNSNTHLVSEPGNADSVITTAAWTSKRYWTDCAGHSLNYTGAVNPGNLSPFSSPGPTRDGREKPDIASPGSVIGSALTQDLSTICSTGNSAMLPDGQKHQVMQGTSMASPHTTGAVTLLMQKFGAISPAWAKAYLKSHATVDSYTGTPWNRDWGWGKLTLGDLVDPVVQVTAPNGGELLVIGASAGIGWSATDNMGWLLVDVLISRTGSAGPFEPIATGLANSGAFAWTVSGPPSEDCWIKVVGRDEAGNTGFDLSDAAFAIVDGATPTLLSRFVATPSAAGVELRWRFADPQRFSGVTLERAGQEAGPWTALAVEVRVDEGDVVALDGTAEAGLTYWYRLSASMGATRVTFGPVKATAGEPIAELALGRPVPNPTGGTTRLELAVPAEARVRVGVYDLQGRQVASLVDGMMPAGRHLLSWDGMAGGRSAAPGVYLVRLHAGRVNLVRRLVVTR